jgi:hypothetical protein
MRLINHAMKKSQWGKASAVYLRSIRQKGTMANAGLWMFGLHLQRPGELTGLVSGLCEPGAHSDITASILLFFPHLLFLFGFP